MRASVHLQAPAVSRDLIPDALSGARVCLPSVWPKRRSPATVRSNLNRHPAFDPSWGSIAIRNPKIRTLPSKTRTPRNNLRIRTPRPRPSLTPVRVSTRNPSHGGRAKPSSSVLRQYHASQPDTPAAPAKRAASSLKQNRKGRHPVERFHKTEHRGPICRSGPGPAEITAGSSLGGKDPASAGLWKQALNSYGRPAGDSAQPGEPKKLNRASTDSSSREITSMIAPTAILPGADALPFPPLRSRRAQWERSLPRPSPMPANQPPADGCPRDIFHHKERPSRAAQLPMLDAIRLPRRRRRRRRSLLTAEATPVDVDAPDAETSDSLWNSNQQGSCGQAHCFRNRDSTAPPISRAE